MKRLAPFLDLLDARYLPLLFAAAPQSYTVYLWLYHGSDKSGGSVDRAPSRAPAYGAPELAGA